MSDSPAQDLTAPLESKCKGFRPLLARVHGLPAALAYAWCWHGVTIRPSLAVGSCTNGAALHLAGIAKTTDLANTGLLLASTALLVWQLIHFSYYGLKGDIVMKGCHRACP
jgi:hypothetical protein